MAMIMQWVRRLRGAISMGLTWAFGWACIGLLIGVSSRLFPGAIWDRFFEVFDAPLPAMGVPGFIGGAMFSLVLGVAARRRRFDELSIRRVALWGALGGLLVGLVPAAMVAVGLATLDATGAGLLRLTAVITVPLVALSSASASATFLLARRASNRTLSAAHPAG
jgi:drug/metabolite transporter (DMT)-like permease